MQAQAECLGMKALKLSMIGCDQVGCLQQEVWLGPDKLGRVHGSTWDQLFLWPLLCHECFQV